MRDSVASGNSGVGILAKSQVDGPNLVMTLDHVAATSNGIGIEADGSDMGAGGIGFSNTQVSGNGTGLLSANGGSLVSFGNNYVIGNGTDGAPTALAAVAVRLQEFDASRLNGPFQLDDDAGVGIDAASLEAPQCR